MFENFINYENETKLYIKEYFDNKQFQLTPQQEKFAKNRISYIPQETSKQKQQRLKEEDIEKQWQELNKKLDMNLVNIDKNIKELDNEIENEIISVHNDMNIIKKENQDTVRVWDLDLDQWRSFRIDSVINIETL